MATGCCQHSTVAYRQQDVVSATLPFAIKKDLPLPFACRKQTVANLF